MTQLAPPLSTEERGIRTAPASSPFASATSGPFAPPGETGDARRPLRLLTLSTLFPNPAQPNHGVFVENRLRHLLSSGEAASTVLAPVPWFPGRTPSLAAIPALETRHGIAVMHPRFPAPPGLGMLTNPYAIYRVAAGAITGMLRDGFAFDAIDAHYLYPDGVAAVWLGKRFGLPVVVTARGSDVSLLPRHRVPRRLIGDAIQGAAALIAVSAGLRDGLVALGAPPSKVTVLRNGVDLNLFRPPANRQALRASLGLGDSPLLLSVGLLIERKGHDKVIAALRDLPGHHLLIVGEGPERAALTALAARLGVADRVRFEGAVSHALLPRAYGAADAMVLASSREGWANVLLESMACGTPVVASPAWGSREAVAAPEAGLVLDEATPSAIAAGVRRLLSNPPDRAATRHYAERFGWEETTAGQLALFRRVLGNRA
ncbi:glycosyltransferase [Roseomonas sp. SSH11]|uniref:Glycosyltransferase n=1 Tax=Pararoseomonas baculiformis TaxID=2820812 RepID=A0ABS4ADQ7_9PROT|nr:glycosyltransferase [Pararoseomonas baculiformis]MBP0445145.1 glycosyltransferase [Pararoseomonas baculiformis]